ncbi:transcription antitermination factor NusB, partial [Slackia exigua]
ATRLSKGVAATWGTLDEFIDRTMSSPDDIQADVRDALRVSAYELVFLHKPPHVVVDQGVELVRFVEPKAANLANAVLHRMVEAADDFPFGDPETDDAALARSCAFPGWISRRLIDELGRADAAEFMRASMGDAPVFVAVNFVRAKVSEIIQAFKEVGTEVEPIAGVPGCLRVHGAKAFKTPRIKRLFDEGKMLVSDQSAQAVALFALPKERPARFLEIGSGRATKTVLMQSAAYRRYGAFMDMVSVDDHAFKAEILRERMESYGIEGVEARVADGRMLSKSFDAGSFDAVFVDAPCSGIGTLRRHPEIKWRLAASDVSTLAMTGFDMLIEAAGLVRVGGMLTYSTCTAFKEENEQVVDRFLKMKTGESFVVESTMAVKLVEGGPDAHYAVRLRRVR